jgi:5-methyltetrahydropteroyltriglutamate--homocysteine methyltransferase
MLGATLAPVVPMVCTGQVTYKGSAAVQRDIENLKAALNGTPRADVFMPAVAPSGVGKNEYYGTDQEYLHAVSNALREEYQAITNAGFVVQIDDPFLTELYSYSELSTGEKRKTAEMYVEALNHGLRGIAPEKVRYHTCYGINEGPRVYDAPLKDIIDLVLKVNAGAYSFEAANPRHEHEYHLWETVKLPEGKAIIPGIITHASNIVEHPELIAERIVRYARLVGRERVIAGSDCGFSSQATYTPEIHPTVIWAKFRAMAEGARLASKQLGYRQ